MGDTEEHLHHENYRKRFGFEIYVMPLLTVRAKRVCPKRALALPASDWRCWLIS